MSTTKSKSESDKDELVTERGKTTIDDQVVSKVAEIAAREIKGVHELSAGMGGTIRRIASGGDSRGSGASVEVGERQTAVDLAVVVNDGVSIPQLATALRENVIERVEYATGLEVTEVNIEISDLFFPEDARRDREKNKSEQRVE